MKPRSAVPIRHAEVVRSGRRDTALPVKAGMAKRSGQGLGRIYRRALPEPDCDHGRRHRGCARAEPREDLPQTRVNDRVRQSFAHAFAAFQRGSGHAKSKAGLTRPPATDTRAPPTPSVQISAMVSSVLPACSPNSRRAHGTSHDTSHPPRTHCSSARRVTRRHHTTMPPAPFLQTARRLAYPPPGDR